MSGAQCGDCTYTVGVIRVITQTQDRVEAHGRLLERWFPSIKTVSCCIPHQPEGVHDAITKQAAVPKVEALARQLAARGVDGIVVSCADDPGVAEARATVSVPVVGAGESTAAAAARFLGPVGVIGITPDAPAAYARILGDRLMANLVPRGVTCTLDLETAAGRQAACDTALELRAQGARCIALACTGFATIGLAPVLEKAAGIPVLDCVLCEGASVLQDMLRADALRSIEPGPTSRRSHRRIDRG